VGPGRGRRRRSLSLDSPRQPGARGHIAGIALSMASLHTRATGSHWHQGRPPGAGRAGERAAGGGGVLGPAASVGS
jgi:hypothetical protein